MTTTSRPTVQVRNKQYIAGIKQLFATFVSIVLNGKAFSPAALIALFQAQIDAADAVAPAKGAWQKTVSGYRQAAADVKNVKVDFEQFVRAQCGNDEQKLALFGLSPKKVRGATPAVKAVAVQKAAATRQVRHTMGKKQKAKVKGTTPPSPVPTPAPKA